MDELRADGVRLALWKENQGGGRRMPMGYFWGFREEGREGGKERLEGDSPSTPIAHKLAIVNPSFAINASTQSLVQGSANLFVQCSLS